MRKFLRLIIILLFKLIQKRIPRKLLRQSIGYESLSPYEKFIADGGNYLLHSNLNLDINSTAVVLGAYLGNSCQILNEKYSCKIIAVEPVSDYLKFLEVRFEGMANISILPYAASDVNGTLEINIMDDATSQIRSSGDNSAVETIQARDVVTLLELQSKRISFIEINIEGAEYSVINRMIAAQVIKNIDIIVVQFHDFLLDSDLLRAEIRKCLRATHTLCFNYDFVWERWEKIDH